jgi:hypothetical protein
MTFARIQILFSCKTKNNILVSKPILLLQLSFVIKWYESWNYESLFYMKTENMNKSLD